ncbi:MAG: lipopolysaccharide biosynthesis protein [Ignavibacteriae bacterium]|nr:lipopolysaccharide biosynthesis protein [Ignavibacteriota bacterium]
MTEIRKNIRLGIFYTGLSRYSDIVVSIFIGATLARLLTPEEFGIVAIVSVFTNFFNLLSSFGIGAAIVQNQNLNDEDISSIFSFSIIFGFILAAIFFFSAPFIADFYNEPVLINLSRLMAIAILFNSLKIVPSALNSKKLRFKELGIVSVVVHIITGIIAIILAYAGFSYYSLIINSILSGFLTFSAFFYLAPVIPTLKIKIDSIKKILKFSTFQFLFHFINYFAGNTDNLLIGKYFNVSALGFYEKAYKLMLMPVQNLTHVITPVLHPVLSKYQDDKSVIYEAYYKIVKLLAIIGFPLSIFLYFNSREIINIFYGSQWDLSIPVFQLLALAVGIQILLATSGSIFQATNRTDLLFYSGLISTIFVVVGILLGIFIGKDLIYIGYGILTAFSINFFQAFYLLVKISLQKSFTKFLNVLVFPLFLSAVLAAILFSFSYYFFIENVFFSIIIKSIISIVTWGILLYMSKENFHFVLDHVKKMMKK